MKRVLALVLLAGALACGESRISLQVAIPDATGALRPAAGVRVVALPYDRDSLLNSMENAATTPRPSTEALDSLFQVFREPFAESTRFATLTDQMRLAVQEAESDPARAGEVAALRDSLQVLEARQAEASRRLTLVRNEVGPRIDSLRTIMREWEAEAFRGWAEVTQSLTSGRLAPGITDTTGQDGTAELSLPPGSRSWWVYARSFNSGDPHSEWYWNLPASGPTMILDTSTARLRPRY